MNVAIQRNHRTLGLSPFPEEGNDGDLGGRVCLMNMCPPLPLLPALCADTSHGAFLAVRAVITYLVHRLVCFLLGPAQACQTAAPCRLLLRKPRRALCRELTRSKKLWSPQELKDGDFHKGPLGKPDASGRLERSLGSTDSHVRRGVCWPGPEEPRLSSRRDVGPTASYSGHWDGGFG